MLKTTRATAKFSKILCVTGGWAGKWGQDFVSTTMPRMFHGTALSPKACFQRRKLTMKHRNALCLGHALESWNQKVRNKILFFLKRIFNDICLPLNQIKSKFVSFSFCFRPLKLHKLLRFPLPICFQCTHSTAAHAYHS